MSGGTVKVIKGGKTEDEPYVETITLRGVEYTIREATVTEYKDCLKQATDKETGFTPFGALLEALVIRTVSPSPAARSTPMPYPIWRRLEGIVNEMHFTDIESDEERDARIAAEAKAASDEGEGEGEEKKDDEVPNS